MIEIFRKQNKSWTLVSALEEIWKQGKDSKLSEEYFCLVKEACAYVKSRLNVSPIQAYIIAVLMDAGKPLFLRDISRYAGCSNILLMSYKKELDELHDRWMINWVLLTKDGNFELGYGIRPLLIEAIQEDKTFTAKPICEYTAYEALEQIGKWIKIIERENTYFRKIADEIIGFMKSASHITFIRTIEEKNLPKAETLLLLIAIHAIVFNHQDMITQADYLEIFQGHSGYQMIILTMNEESNILNTIGYMECDCVEGLSEPYHYRLTKKAKTELLSEFSLLTYKKRSVSLAKQILPENIEVKQLFYNDTEKKQIERLSDLLSQEKFPIIKERMKAANMRPGFACLFYGSPGTGKTESVMQLARTTDRNVLLVDIARLRSKWVGESEKQIQALFDQYEELATESKVCPILLINEADAIICKRTSNTSNSVDKMENTLQNIILQAMERLNGILIATTNLTENMDPAFERRFLFKIKFEKPTVEVKTQIWHSMLPSIAVEEASLLAKRYNFSGGQIENIARKQIVENVLSGEVANVKSIQKFCEEESIISKSNPIGFI